MMLVAWRGITSFTSLQIKYPLQALGLGSILAAVYAAFVFPEVKELIREMTAEMGIPSVFSGAGWKDREL
jgi:hypothetical protein